MRRWGRCVAGPCESYVFSSYETDIYPLVSKEVLRAEGLVVEHRAHYTWDTDHWRFVQEVRWRHELKYY